jgi:hypothetical protein
MSSSSVWGMSPVSIEDITTRLLSLTSDVISFARRSPHLGYIERDSIICGYEEEYFRLARLADTALHGE